jgi:hypothetical protein
MIRIKLHNSYKTTTTLTATLIVGIIGILSTASLTHAAVMTKPTSGGSLNVVVQPSPDPVVKGTQTNLKVSFDQKGGSTVQPHIDYDLTISNAAGKQLFQASALAGHPNQPLHTAEGVVTIPYTFQEPGADCIKVTVYGILFNPINPETAQFQIEVK